MFFAFNANSRIPIPFVPVLILCLFLFFINNFVASVKYVQKPLSTEIEKKGLRHVRLTCQNAILKLLYIYHYGCHVPLRLSVPLQMKIKMNYFKQKYFYYISFHD